MIFHFMDEPQKPPIPSRPQSLPPQPPMPPRPITPPAGVPVKETNISNLSPSPAPLQSSIRTMGNDLGTPAPVRPMPPPRPLPPPPSPIRPPALPVRPIPSVTPPPGITRPTPPLSRPVVAPPASVSIPQGGSGSSKKWLVIGASIVILAGVLLWFFAIRGNNAEPTPTASETPTPTPTPIPTPTPLAFFDIFRTQGPLVSTTLNADITGQKLTAGELRMYTVVDAGQVPKTFDQFATDHRLNAPVDLTTAVQNSEFFITLFGKTDGTTGRGFVVKINDLTKVQSALMIWESTLSTNLKNLFVINTARAATPGFLTNTYQGVLIHYRNFRDALTSIDYAIVTMPDGANYLVFTSSRDHMFVIIDRVTGALPGK